MAVQESSKYKIRFEDFKPDASLKEDRGWHKMDVRWLITRQSVGSTMTVVGRTTMPPGVKARHALHKHPNAEEWELVLEGVGLKHVGDESFILRPGELCFIPRNVYHGLENALRHRDARQHLGLLRGREPAGGGLRDPRGRGSTRRNARAGLNGARSGPVQQRRRVVPAAASGQVVRAAHGAVPLFELRDISKAFPGVQALSAVSFAIRAGEVHVLLGENGAGKSTLMKILCGAYRADAGELLQNGEPVAIRSPADARALGHRGDLPGVLARPLPQRRREHLPRTRAARALSRHDRPRPDARRGARLLDLLGVDLDTHALGAHARRRAAAAGRDRQGALAGRPDPRARRADLRALRPRDRAPVRRDPPAAGARAWRWSTSRTGCRRCSRSATASRCCATASASRRGRRRDRRPTSWST